METILKKLDRIAIIFALFFAFNGLVLANVLPSGGKDGSYWRPGSVQHISWDKLFVDTTKTLDIYLWNGDSSSLTLIANNIIPTTESYFWYIPNDQVLGEHFKIRLSYTNDTTNFYLISKDFFPISNEAMVLNSNIFVATPPELTITISPLPASIGNMLNVYCESQFFHIDIYDINGSLLNSHNFSYTNSYDVDISNLTTGTYMLQIKFLDKTITEHFVID